VAHSSDAELARLLCRKLVHQAEAAGLAHQEQLVRCHGRGRLPRVGAARKLPSVCLGVLSCLAVRVAGGPLRPLVDVLESAQQDRV